jgi:hypothetical protein
MASSKQHVNFFSSPLLCRQSALTVSSPSASCVPPRCAIGLHLGIRAREDFATSFRSITRCREHVQPDKKKKHLTKQIATACCFVSKVMQRQVESAASPFFRSIRARVGDGADSRVQHERFQSGEVSHIGENGPLVRALALPNAADFNV